MTVNVPMCSRKYEDGAVDRRMGGHKVFGVTCYDRSSDWPRLFIRIGTHTHSVIDKLKYMHRT